MWPIPSYLDWPDIKRIESWLDCFSLLTLILQLNYLQLRFLRQQFQALQQQFQLLQHEVQAHSLSAELTSTALHPLEASDSGNDDQQARVATLMEPIHSANGASGQFRLCHEPRLEKLTESDDVEHFLFTFERIAAACRWPKSEWVFRLIPLLTGKARGAYVHMDFDDSCDYDDVKPAILRKYDINPESYRQRFALSMLNLMKAPKSCMSDRKNYMGSGYNQKINQFKKLGK